MIEVKEEDHYCRKCGGFVNMKEYAAMLSHPVQYRYFCKDCGAHVLTEKGGVFYNVQDKND